MVCVPARWPVILLVVLHSSAISAGQTFETPLVRSKTLPPQQHRVIVRNGDVVVLEGDAQVQIVRRRPAFVRMIAEPNREYLVLLVEYLRASGQVPTRRTDKAAVYSSPEGAWQWPLPPEWEGLAWLEEDGGARPEHSMLTAIETADGTIFFTKLQAGAATPNPLTQVRFLSSQSTASTQRPSFDVAERDALAAAARLAVRQPILK